MVERITTARLHLRPFAVEDVEAAFQWFRDPDVMRFIANGPDRSLEDTRRRVARYREHQAIHGFSKWVIRELGSALPIGDSGLLVLDSGDVDLGFRLSRRCWGRGLATEVASAWIRVAFLDLGLSRLTAFAHPQNTASLRVLEKMGFRATGAHRVMGMDAITFSYEVADYRPRAGVPEGDA